VTKKEKIETHFTDKHPCLVEVIPTNTQDAQDCNNFFARRKYYKKKEGIKTILTTSAFDNQKVRELYKRHDERAQSVENKKSAL